MRTDTITITPQILHQIRGEQNAYFEAILERLEGIERRLISLKGALARTQEDINEDR